MNRAASLRRQIEEVLATRVTAPLTLRECTETERIPCGTAAIDDLLQGGLPVGVLTEFVGSECSGRTTMTLAYMAALTSAGNVCAWIDVADALDPESVAANGVDLTRLLWVRCGTSVPEQASIGSVVDAAGLVPVATASPGQGVRGGGSPHPRSEGRDMPEAIGSMLQAHGGLYDRQVRREKKSLGTPGMPNRPLHVRSLDREEQVASDRVPKPRGELVYAARCAEPLPKGVHPALKKAPIAIVAHARPETPTLKATKPWTALDKALRTADLLLQNGGFSAIVLDLGSTPAEFSWRIPLATWFRFRAACERTRVSLILLTQHPCARSSAELVVRMDTGVMDSAGKVMVAVRYKAEVERQRTRGEEKVIPIRRPPQSERGRWKGGAAWAQPG